MSGAQIWETVSEWTETAGERIMPSPKESESQSGDCSDPVLRSDDKSAEELKSDEKEKAESEDQEDEECGFCLFMKGGGCKDAFMDWENCAQKVKDGEDVAKKCFDVSDALVKCMLVHSDYYGPILRAEKAANEEALRVLEKEAASEGSDQKTETK